MIAVDWNKINALIEQTVDKMVFASGDNGYVQNSGKVIVSDAAKKFFRSSDYNNHSDWVGSLEKDVQAYLVNSLQSHDQNQAGERRGYQAYRNKRGYRRYRRRRLDD